MAILSEIPQQIDAGLIRLQLGKILASKGFAQAHRLSSFLRFVVDFALSDDPGPLKEFMIGVRVYEKSASYDTKEEPIVRIEARRLRAKLEEYYATEGVADEVLIEVPKGGYMPRFVVREQATPDPLPVPAAAALEPAPTGPLKPATALPEQRKTAASLARTWGLWAVVLALSLAVILLSLRMMTSPAPRNRLTHIEPLTSFPGNAMQAALSPDGREVAFSWNGADSGSNYDLYVKLVDVGEPVRLTTNPAHDLHPAWSPDGRYLAFLRVSPESSEIVLIPALGGPERHIAQIMQHQPWKADAAQMEANPGPVWSAKGDYLVAADSAGENMGVALFAVSLEDGSKRRLTTPPGLAVDGYPAFSADGTQLAFVRQTSNSVRDLFLLNLSDGSVRQLTRDGSDVKGLVWSNDGQSLYFASNRAGTYQLWQVPARGGSPEILVAGGGQITEPFLAHDGHSLLYTETVENSNIWSVPLSTRPQQATELIVSTRRNNSAQYSPDGKSIAFVSDRSGSWEIWLADVEGHNPQQLTHFGGSIVGTPHWSPDSRMLAFDARPRGKSDIFTISIAAGRPVQQTHDAFEDKMPNWSHDGRYLYYDSNAAGQQQMWKLPVAGGRPVRLTTQLCRDLAESVDGQTIYFESVGRRGIWQVSSHGGDERPVPELADVFPNRYMAVGAEGIYFVDSEVAPRRIQLFRFADRRIQTLGVIAKNLVDGTPSLSISRDGHTALFAQQDESRSSIMRVRNP
jgi:Tol biopolymer transport system component